MLSFDNVQTKNIDLQTINIQCNPNIFNYIITKQDTDSNILPSDVTPSRKTQYIKNHYKTLAHFIPTYAYTSNKDIESRNTCTLPDHMLNVYQNMTGQSCRTLTGAQLLNGYSNNEIQKGCVLSLDKTTDDMRGIINQLQQSIDNANIVKLSVLNADINEYRNNKIPYEKGAANAQEVLRDGAINTYNMSNNACSNIKYSIALSNQIVKNRDAEYNRLAYEIEQDNIRRQTSLMEMYYTSNLDLLVRNRRDLSGITVYEHIWYQGISSKIPLPTNFTRCNVFDYHYYSQYVPYIWSYFPNDMISSIKIPNGVHAHCYQHVNYRGIEQTYWSSVDNLVNYGFNDTISSLTIWGVFNSTVSIDRPEEMRRKINNYQLR